MKKGWATVVLFGCCAAASIATTLQEELNELSSRVQSMSRGYYTVGEWERLIGDLDVLGMRAEKERSWDVLLEARLLKSVIFADLLKDYDRGLRTIRQLREKLKNIKPDRMPRLYVREAEIHALRGDEAAIMQLIEEFKRSPYFDAETYAYRGGWGREVPLSVVRPSARGNDSLTVTAMEVARQRARANRGRLFPDFALWDGRGNVVKLADLRGKVVIVDFWSPNWTPWRQDLPNLLYLKEKFGPRGLEIIGIPQGITLAEADAFSRKNGMSWPQLQSDRELTRRLGVYGDTVNFVIDRNGVIIARNVRGADLVRAVRLALGVD